MKTSNLQPCGVYVERIASSADKRIAQVVELYGTLFPEGDGINYAAEEVVAFMNARFEEQRHVEVENIILVAMLKETVVGFLFCHLYPERRKAIISYFAINKEIIEARHSAARKLLTMLHRSLLSSNACDVLFYESQSIVPGSPKKIASACKARHVLFKQRAKALGLQVREFRFSYQCPRISLSEGAHEYPSALFGIGLITRIPEQVPRAVMLEYLRFIYLDCYGDLYAVSDPRFEEHQRHLRGIVQQYENSLPEFVATV